ncbi:hypothetical protein HQQ80_11475 [Microbacteriaceae bacterium VKM Ac-2855]|nr:hypothetical protein [Microbacteriaceae bacterium VKM Ac-2855]
MALLHRATITPTKLELVEAWAPTQPWGSGGGYTQLGSYRFDDPAGEVGIETLVVRAESGAVLQVPLTYRGEPLPGGEAALITTMEHSALGTRWVYDAMGDPVAVAAFVNAARTGAEQAEQFIEGADGAPAERREPTVRLRGSGSADRGIDVPLATDPSSDEVATVVIGDGYTLTLPRVLGAALAADGETLVGRWDDAEPVLFAAVR